MNHVVSIGGGLSSTMMLPEHVVEKYGRQNVHLVMARLPNEDPDVWRLCDAVEARLGLTIEYIGLNKTPWDIFFESRILGNSRIDPCSRRLKREVMRDWMKAHCDPASTILHVGITAHEIDRMAAIRANYTRMGWRVEAPMADDMTLTRDVLMEECRRRFGFVPRLYEYGWSHNNCGGACIKAGQKEWARLLRFIPDVYAWWENNEQAIQPLLAQPMTILRDRTGGTTKPLSLRTFRERMRARWVNMLPGMDPFEGLDETPACAYCVAA